MDVSTSASQPSPGHSSTSLVYVSLPPRHYMDFRLEVHGRKGVASGHEDVSLYRSCNVWRRLALFQERTHKDSKNHKLHKTIMHFEILVIAHCTSSCIHLSQGVLWLVSTRVAMSVA